MTAPSEDVTVPPARPQDTATPPPSSPSEGATLPATDAAATAPALVPGYEILGELGRGGMGVVYKARQVAAGRVVALKMILAGEHAGADELARFRTEAEAVARLSHSNIVAVYEVGEHAGRPFFSLEYCNGGSLEAKLRGTPLPPREAAILMETLARAVHSAHRAGVLHRDLKPANVLLAADGSPKITDFGLAKKLDADAGQTRTGAVMGTPSYMAPEQASGAKDVGPAADIYALGAVLYECLVGRPPFRAATAFDTILQVVGDDPPPPRQVNRGVPRDLETIALKCLHKSPAKRYATALELADDLRRFLGGETVRARPVGLAERAWKWARRRPTTAGLIAVSVLAGLLVLGLGIYFTGQLKRERDTAQWEKEQADEARDQARERLAVARRNLMTATLLRVASLVNRDPAEAGRLLEDETLCPVEERDLTWHIQASNCASRRFSRVFGFVQAAGLTAEGRLVVLERQEEKPWQVSVWDTKVGKQIHRWSLPEDEEEAARYTCDLSRDGRLLSVGTDDGHRIDLFDALTGKKLHSFPVKGGLRAHRFSRTGRTLMATVNGEEIGRELHAWDTKSGKRRGSVTLPAGSEIRRDDLLGVLDEGETRVLCRVDARTVREYDLAGGKPGAAWTLPENTLPDYPVLLAPGGKYVAVRTQVGFQFFDLASKTVKWTFQPTGEQNGDGGLLDFSPDGKTLAVIWTGARSHVHLVDCGTGLESRAICFSQTGLFRVALGIRLLAGFGAGEGGLWTVGVSDEGNTVDVWKLKSDALTVTPLRGWGACPSPDGTRVAYPDDLAGPEAVVLSASDTGKEIWRVKVPVAAVGMGDRPRAFTPDGKRLIIIGEGSLALWDAASGKELKRTALRVSGLDPKFAMTPDGKRIAFHQEGGDELSFRTWDVEQWQEAGRFPIPGGHLPKQVAFSRDGRLVAVVVGEQDRCEVRDVPSGELRYAIDLPEESSEKFTGVLAFNPARDELAVVRWPGMITFLNPLTGKELKTITDFRGSRINQLTFFPDGKTLVVRHNVPTRGGNEGASEVTLVDVPTGLERCRLSFPIESPLEKIDVSRDGKALIAVTKHGLHIWRRP